MNEVQFAAFTQSMTDLRLQPRSRRPENFSSGDGAEWLIWRQNLEVILTLNEWNTPETRERAKNETLASISGEAKRQISEMTSAGDQETVAVFLGRIQERFLPAAASQFAKSEYDGCSQLPGEKLIGWHGRLRTLFIRAYPAQAGDLNDNDVVIRKFILGLSNSTIKTYVLDGAPVTFAAALERAQNKAATEATVAGSVPPGGKIVAIDTPSTAQANRNLRRRGPEAQMGPASPVQLCWTCGKAGHYSRECRSGGAASAGNAAVGAVRRGRGRGRGTRAGRGQTGRGRGRFNGRRIAGIDPYADADEFGDVVSDLARDIDENPRFADDAEAGN